MDTQEIIGWLNSDEGFTWSSRHFDDATDCHEMIEIIDDHHPNVTWWGDSVTKSTQTQFRYLRQRAPEWRDLKWTPDQPPEGGQPWKKKKKMTPPTCR